MQHHIVTQIMYPTQLTRLTQSTWGTLRQHIHRHTTDLELNLELFTSTLVWLLQSNNGSANNTASFACRQPQVEIPKDTRRIASRG